MNDKKAVGAIRSGFIDNILPKENIAGDPKIETNPIPAEEWKAYLNEQANMLVDFEIIKSEQAPMVIKTLRAYCSTEIQVEQALHDLKAYRTTYEEWASKHPVKGGEIR